ncbi:MAG: hypothetical protein GX352_04185 [Clostridiales bacterium]|mgnify:CR=1 FL=1|nr:hypothetical protein [Clostridiales bacterium]
MYDKRDIESVKTQLKKIIALLVIVFIFFMTVAIVVALNKSNNGGMVIMVAGVCFLVFIWGMYVMPAYIYYRFLEELIMGRSREIRGIVKGLSPNPIYKDNKLRFYELVIEEDGVERVLLLDNQKEWPRIEISRPYLIRIHDNFVVDISQN